MECKNYLIVNWSYSEPKKCYGLVKIEHGKGYYHNGSRWIRNDDRAQRILLKYKWDCDWMDVESDEELEAAIRSLREQAEGEQK